MRPTVLRYLALTMAILKLHTRTRTISTVIYDQSDLVPINYCYIHIKRQV